ncbi:MAG: hypothetical protein CMD25_00695 [Flavobacteriales bacterium]|nr:hypothetical protein [Flavobacteriales bacterium]
MNGKLYHNGDHNTYIGFEADDIKLRVGGTDIVNVDSSKNVGITTNSPTSRLHVYGGDNTGLFGSIRNDSKNRMNMKVAMGSTTRYIGTVEQYGNGDSSGFTIRIYDGAEKVFRIVRVVVVNSGGTNVPRATVEGGGEDTDIHINLEYKNRDGDATKTDFFLVPTSKSFTQYVEIEGYILRDTGWNTTSLTSVSLDDDLALNILDSVNGSRVGVGTTDPSAKLHAEGSMIVKGDVGWAGTDNQDGAIFLNTAGRALLGAFSTSYARPLIRTASNYIEHGSAGTSLINGFRFYAGSTTATVGTYDFYTSGSNSRLRIEKGGNVGIGTTNPDLKLHIHGGGIYATPVSYAANADEWLLRAGANNNAGWDYGGLKVRVNSAGNPRLAFMGFSSNEVFAIEGTNVGIGTTDPSEKLHVDEGYILADGASTNHGFELRRDSADTFQIRHLGGNFTINNLTDNRKDLSIDGNGNVGIGTDIPATILDLSKQDNLVELSIRRKGSDPSANTDLGGIQFKTDYTSTSHDVGRILVKTNSSPYRTDMKFSTRSTAGTEMIGMTLHGTSSSGPYLGVGTETPSSLLHVRGSDPVLKITDSSTTDNSATLWLQESDTYGVKLNYESNGGNGGIDYFTIDTLSATGGNNQAGNHDNAWGIDQRGNVMPHKGAVDGNLLKSYEWLLYGPEVSGSTPSFPQNGTTAENARIYGENPFGEPAILWHTPSNDTGDNADGGWNTDTFQIDRGKSYRTSVWVKKITTTTNDGNLYLGTNFVNNLNGTYNSNPYFIGGATMATAGMETGQWYLMVGYIYDSGHSGTANHPDGGIYDRNGRKIYGATSFKFTDSGSPSDGLNSQWNLSKQRVYNYYDQNTGSKTYWWGPRFEPLEESTPTLKELLNTPSSDTGAFFMGAVGVGTTDPSEKLHVYGGDVRISDGTPVLTLHDTSSSALTTLTLDGVNTTLNNAGTNGSLIFSTESAEAMRIDEDGKVGIGVTNPDATLEVKGAGNTNATTSLHVRDSDDQKLLMVRNDGVVTVEHNYFYASASAGAYVQNGLRVRGFLENDQGTLAINGDVNFDSDTLYVDSTNNRVGIGTNNPSSTLQVSNYTGAAGAAAQSVFGDVSFFSDDGDDALFLGLKDATYQNRGWAFQVHANGVNSDLAIKEHGSSAERVRITTDGNVGIGTTDPPQKLTVKGGITHTNSSNIQIVTMTNSSEHGRLIVNQAAGVTRVLLNSNGDSYFNGGDVGIGTTNPVTQLEVQEAAGAPMLQLRPNAASTNLNPIILYRSQLDGSANYMLCQGVSTFFGTYEGGVPTDPSDMIKLQPNSSANPQLHIGDAGSSAAALNVGDNIKLLNNGASYINGGNVGIGTQSPSYTLEVIGDIVGSSKSFLIDHPTQSDKKLMHACIEGPEHGVYFRGKSQDSGIQAPEYWSGLVHIDSMTVDVTPIGPNQSIYVDRIEDNGDVYVGANTDEPLNYFYVIYGERKDIDKLEIVKDK